MTTQTVPAPTRASFERVRPEAVRRRVVGLDGLRALAVVAVIAFHAAPSAFPGGYVGVDVFFVVSGFLITRNLLAEHRSGRLRLGRFWLARARRILPALVLMVITVTPVAVLVGGDLTATLRAQLWGAATFTSNWAMLGVSRSYFSADAPVLFKNLWSLGIEEQFYLLWPLAVLLLADRWRGVRVRLTLALPRPRPCCWSSCCRTSASTASTTAPTPMPSGC